MIMHEFLLWLGYLPRYSGCSGYTGELTPARQLPAVLLPRPRTLTGVRLGGSSGEKKLAEIGTCANTKNYLLQHVFL